MEEILNSILAFHYKLQEKSEFIHRELVRIALEAKSLQDIAATLGSLIDKTVMIQHPEGPVLAYYSNSPENSWDSRKSSAKENSPKPPGSPLLLYPSLSTLPPESQPLHIAAEPEHGLPERFICPIHLKREFTGVLSIFAGSEPIGELDVRSMQYAPS